MCIRKYCITLMLLLFGAGVAHSQENRTEICVDFRVNSTAIDSAYSDNAVRMQEIIDFLRTIRQDSTINIVEVSFCGAASPEGSDQLNRKLARGRLTALEKLVRKEVDIPDSLITYNDSYIPWDYLKSQVEDSGLIRKDEVIAILEEESLLVDYHYPNLHIDNRIVKLKKLDNGKVWQQMNKLFFERMRNACAVFVTYKKELPIIQQPVVTDPEPVAQESESVAQESEPEAPVVSESVIENSKDKQPFYMALKTNLLCDILAIPNLGAEFYLGSNFSLAGNWNYAWWKSDRKHNYWRTYGGDLAVRYWMGKKAHEKPLTGHHIGLYGQMITYDFELGGKGVIADRWSWATGLEYGYSVPIAKRLNLDFTIGLGYHWGEFKEYLPIDGHYVWQATKNRNYWGPTKAEVSLVWLIGRGNYNVKKGGNQ